MEPLGERLRGVPRAAAAAAVMALAGAGLGACAGDAVGGADGGEGDGAQDHGAGDAGVDAVTDKDPIPPGHMTFSVKHDVGLDATDAADRDMRGTLYACAFEADPFAVPGTKPVGATSISGVDLHDPGATVSGTQAGAPAFPNLVGGRRHVLVIFLDDDGDNLAGTCADDAGKVQASAADPIFVGDTPPIIGLATQDIAAVFDHRLEKRIR